MGSQLKTSFEESQCRNPHGEPSAFARAVGRGFTTWVVRRLPVPSVRAVYQVTPPSRRDAAAAAPAEVTKARG